MWCESGILYGELRFGDQTWGIVPRRSPRHYLLAIIPYAIPQATQPTVGFGEVYLFIYIYMYVYPRLGGVSAAYPPPPPP